MPQDFVTRIDALIAEPGSTADSLVVPKFTYVVPKHVMGDHTQVILFTVVASSRKT